MIDDKKIKEACLTSLKESIYNNYMYTCPYVEGFYACAKWMQEKLTTSPKEYSQKLLNRKRGKK